MHIAHTTSSHPAIHDMWQSMNSNDSSRDQERLPAAKDACKGGEELGPMAQQLLGVDAVTEELLTRLVSSSIGSLPELCRSLNLTLDELGEWIAKAANRRRVFNLLALADAQAQVLMSQHGVTAAARLVKLMMDPSSSAETVRRACKDLLQLRVASLGSGRNARGANNLEPLKLEMPREAFPMSPLPGMSKEEMLMLLRKM